MILPEAWLEEGRVKVRPGGFPRGRNVCLHIKVSGGSLSTEVGREYLGQKDSERGCL